MNSTALYKATLKRTLKSCFNLLNDPPPRNSVLTIERVFIEDDTLFILFKALEKTYRVEIGFPVGYGPQLLTLPQSPREQLFTCIGIAFAPFLFKLSDFSGVEVRTALLDQQTVQFYERFLLHGLGEFRYLQGLDPTRTITVLAKPGTPSDLVEMETHESVIMLNGGGKDTIVAAELLKAVEQPFKWLTIRPNKTRRKVIQISGNHNSIEVSYKLDPRIDKDKRYKWGHMPHTSVVLSIGLAIALITRDASVAAGNEFSSNFGNIVYRGFEVNHQYTKSTDYEQRFSDFVNRCITKDIHVFSILRPFDDLQLAKLFSRHPQYFKTFISCNKGIGRNQGEWCKACPKCAFTSLALYPFVSVNEIVSIFGEDVIVRPAIRRYILELVSGRIKPWECVGTSDESALALGLLLAERPELEFQEAPYRADLEAAIKGVDLPTLEQNILLSAQPQHQIPGALAVKIAATLRDSGLLPGGGLLPG